MLATLREPTPVQRLLVANLAQAAFHLRMYEQLCCRRTCSLA